MKKSALPFLLGVVSTLACIGLLISPWWHGFTSRTKYAHCLPMEYRENPSGKVDYGNDYFTAFMPYVFRTETPLQTVKDFYDTNLVHHENWKDDEGSDWRDSHPGNWRRSEVRPGEFLYECYGTVNWEEAETGCIYLRERDGKTIVERIWFYMASAGQPCEWYMSELPE